MKDAASQDYLQTVPDEYIRRIADSKDVAACRQRILAALAGSGLCIRQVSA